MSLRFRLLITLVPLFIAGLVAADVGTHAALQSYLLSRLDDQLVSNHPDVERALIQGGTGGPGGPPVSTSLPTGTYAELLNPSGTVVVTGRVGFGPQGAPTADPHPVIPSGLRPGTAESPVFMTVNGT